MGKQQQLYRQETNLELELLGRNMINQTDLIVSVRHLGSLAGLYRSVVRCSKNHAFKLLILQ